MTAWACRVKQDLGGETIYSVYSLSGQLLHGDNDTSGAATDYVSLGGRAIARRENGVVIEEFASEEPDHEDVFVALTSDCGMMSLRRAAGHALSFNSQPGQP